MYVRINSPVSYEGTLGCTILQLMDHNRDIVVTDTKGTHRNHMYNITVIPVVLQTDPNLVIVETDTKWYAPEPYVYYYCYTCCILDD